MVIGSGSREHALVWKLSSSQHVKQIWVSPGNGGTAFISSKIMNIGTEISKNILIMAVYIFYIFIYLDLPLTDFIKLSDWCKNNSIDLVVVGPETPLAEGICDVLEHDSTHSLYLCSQNFGFIFD